MAKHQSPTQEVLYSFNEGKTWHEVHISDTDIVISNIIIEPFSISQQFVVYGSIIQGEGQSRKGIIINLDFKDLHEPQCKGVENPGQDNSDYELWTPYDGRHGDNKCFMG